MKRTWKKALAMALTLALTLALTVPAMAAEGVTTEEALRSTVAAGGTVTLGGDITLTSPLTIDKAVTIDGAGHSITYNASGAVIVSTTNEDVALNNVTLNAKANGGRGINVSGSSPQLTLTDTTMNVHTRGISFVQVGVATDANVTLTGSHILNSQLPNGSTYDNWAATGDYRGISLFDIKSSNITLEDESSIEGFGYCINASGTKDGNNTASFEGSSINVSDSSIKGWTAFNVWSANTIFNLTDATILGINNSNGSSDGFSAIVVNDDIYNIFDSLHADANQFNIAGGTIKNVQNGSATEQLFRIDRLGVTEVNLALFGDQPVRFIDTTGNVNSVFYSPLMSPQEMQDYVAVMVHYPENCTATTLNNAPLPLAP